MKVYKYYHILLSAWTESLCSWNEPQCSSGEKKCRILKHSAFTITAFHKKCIEMTRHTPSKFSWYSCWQFLLHKTLRLISIDFKVCPASCIPTRKERLDNWMSFRPQVKNGRVLCTRTHVTTWISGHVLSPGHGNWYVSKTLWSLQDDEPLAMSSNPLIISVMYYRQGYLNRLKVYLTGRYVWLAIPH
jgi:hypothetical protein